MNSDPAPCTPQKLLAQLDALDIEYKTYHHQRIFTVKQAQEAQKTVPDAMPGGHSKNLFVRNKKGQMWLYSCLDDKKIDLKKLGRLLDAGRLSFGSPERLMTHLGVIPGAVTPFALINDPGNQVKLVLDADLMDQSPVNFHPLDNSMTTSLNPQDFYRFLDHIDHNYKVERFDFMNE